VIEQSGLTLREVQWKISRPWAVWQGGGPTVHAHASAAPKEEEMSEDEHRRGANDEQSDVEAHRTPTTQIEPTAEAVDGSDDDDFEAHIMVRP
jgi:hypothetical protein